MTKNRLEAFSDGVIAIIITIMVLDLKVPAGADLASLQPLGSTFLCYAMSFIYVAIYWNNHHHMLHAAPRISAAAMWANMGLLFCLSIVPFVTSWMGHHPTYAVPVALYGVLLLCCAVSYTILARALIAANGRDSALALAIGRDRKGQISLTLYVIAIAVAFVHEVLAFACYVIVAIIWLVPDRRIERVLDSGDTQAA